MFKRLPFMMLVTFLMISFSLMTSPLAFAEGGSFDGMIGTLNGHIVKYLFFDVLFFTDAVSLPFAVAWLVVGSVYFTFKMGFINIRGFKHAIDVTRGMYDNESDKGEVSHFQALTAALSATVGLGNIAGVAIAVSIGGPGATFWMIVAGILGMSSKFVECTLGQMYRKVGPDGKVMGGAMEYLSTGFAEKGKTGFGKFLAILFCILCIGGSFGGGNAFQVSQSMSAFKTTVPIVGEHPWIYGLFMAFAVGIVIIGGIKRIASTAEKIVPLMCVIYCIAALFVIMTNLGALPGAIATIIEGAFTPAAGYGGMIGVLVQGFKRAAFSNEAGIGSAAIAHSAAKTDYPVREGMVSLLEPFIDTIIICTMTALVIVITGAYDSADPAMVAAREASQGAALTSLAFQGAISWFPHILSIAVVLFAYSTMISWSYYGERCWSYMFGDSTAMIYRVLFVIVVFLGSITSAGNVLDFSDLMILAMAVPNIIGLYALSGKVKSALNEYMENLNSGKFKKHAPTLFAK